MKKKDITLRILTSLLLVMFITVLHELTHFALAWLSSYADPDRCWALWWTFFEADDYQGPRNSIRIADESLILGGTHINWDRGQSLEPFLSRAVIQMVPIVWPLLFGWLSKRIEIFAFGFLGSTIDSYYVFFPY